MIAVRIHDDREEEIPPLGYLELEDPETGERVVVNSSNASFQAAFTAFNRGRQEALTREFRRSKVDVIDIATGEPYVKPLIRFFQERARRQR